LFLEYNKTIDIEHKPGNKSFVFFPHNKNCDYPGNTDPKAIVEDAEIYDSAAP